MRATAITDIGKTRAVNQDYIYASVEGIGCLPNLFVVADGMGGHKAGDTASRYTVETIKELIAESEETDALSVISEAVKSVNTLLIKKAGESEDYQGMGTTLVISSIFGNVLRVANVGDSRLYVIHQGETKQITLDHSLVEELIRTGQLDRRRVRFHPEKNIITRALGTGKEAVPDFFEIALQNGEKVLLCSDGLTNMVEDDEIGTIVMGQRFVDKICEQLIERANYYGGKDNIGVVVVEQALNEV